MTEFIKLKIKSDGTSRNTQVLTEDGKVLMGITHIDICIGADDEVSATVRIIQPELELEGIKAEILEGNILEGAGKPIDMQGGDPPKK